MGMVVRSNVMAVNAFRQLGMNNSQVSKSLEKLSSGYRINRAGDDASGLAISEKMKAQIKGLETASANSQDGISLIQTAEGALTEVHDMLNRMVELAGKAANGTMDNDVDRAALQKEVDALLEEIDRIADGTNFNGLKLLNGSLGAGRAEVQAVKAEYESGKITQLNQDGDLTIGGHTVNITDVNGNNNTLQKQLEAFVTDYNQKAADKDNWEAKLNDTNDGIVFVAKKEGALDTNNVQAPAGTTQKTAGVDAAPAVDGNGGLTLQIGDTADDFNKITVSINDMSAKGLGIENINVGTQEGAAEALDLVKKGAASAINVVSATRADLGAMQNRLEHTINNLDVAAENMTSANSRIRDTDMALSLIHI